MPRKKSAPVETKEDSEEDSEEEIDHDLKEQLDQKVNLEKWLVSKTIIKNWCEKAQEFLKQFSSDGKKQQLEEMMHYLTLDQLTTNTIITQPELYYVKTIFVEQYQDGVLAETDELAGLRVIQSPNETFGEQVKGMPCRKCQSMNTIGPRIMQKRSIDEPSNVFYSCLDCKEKWKT